MSAYTYRTRVSEVVGDPGRSDHQENADQSGSETTETTGDSPHPILPDGGDGEGPVVDAPPDEFYALTLARAAYARGRSRSRSGLYRGAAADFGVARQFGRDAYFYDDAVYYQARALHRSGALAKAEEAYEHLLSLSTGEGRPYRGDAMRFLRELRSSTEEQVAR